MGSQQKINLYTAASIVIANMIGTGVFTSLGFQVITIQSVFVLMMLWLVGGVVAYFGALSYAELGAALPRSGGEYNFLSSIYHPAVGFISGWVSATVGFAAPTALAAITFGTYTAQVFPHLNATWLAVGLLLAVTGIHATTIRNSGFFQRIFTTLKLVLILGFVIIGLTFTPDPQPISLFPHEGDWSLLTGGAFAISLIYVSYAYTGWNAATYLINEMNQPARNLPLSLGAGTLIVMALYLLLNYVFLFTAPMQALAGKVEIGYISAQYIMGGWGSKAMGLTLAILLISTVSAMVFAGPRVLQMIGEDFRIFRRLARTNKQGVPSLAIWTQTFISLIFILTATFESILIFSGFVMGCTTLLTVAGVFVLRWRQPDLPRPYRAWGYPFTTGIYLMLMLWTLTYLLRDKPEQSLPGLGLLGLGALMYAGSKWAEKRMKHQD